MKIQLTIIVFVLTCGFLFGAAREAQGQIEAQEQIAPAASLTVTKTADTDDGVCDADCSLREAVAVAGSGDTINFASPLFDTAQTVSINGQITINKSLTITGRSAALTTLNSIAAPSATSRIFLILSGTVNLSKMSVTNANLNAPPSPSLPNCSQMCGGAIFNAANLTLSEMVFSNNRITGSASSNKLGGAIFNNGPLRIFSSTFFNNSVSDSSSNFKGGGAIYQTNANGGQIVNSTFSNNSISSTTSSFTQSYGGAIASDTFALVLLNTTVVNNSINLGNNAQCFGGGVAGGITARNVLIANNSLSGCQITASAPDISSMTSRGNNLIGNTSDTNISGDTTGNILNQNARLAPLGNYGGATPTVPLLSNSPAINAGNNCVTDLTCSSDNPPSALTADQRGANRVGNVDIGAFEVSNSANGGSFVVQLPTGTQNVGYNQIITPNNGAFTYSVSAGLPDGVNLTTNFAPNAVVALSGTPTNNGTFNFAVTASDGTNSNVTNYSLQVLGPTAASVSIGGRVLINNGRGLSGAVVRLTGASGETHTARTNSFGYYRFTEVEAGQIVVVAVFSKRHQFAPQVLTVAEDINDLNFAAQQ